MAGLLGDFNYFGDNTTKDQFGQTQADRREPLWAGLIQGGMGLLAAGQDLTPAQRAQMIAQAGQTYGGIPKAMMDQRGAAAQQTLQGQQIKAGQSKLDAQARLAELAKTPEFQAAVAKLEPEERMLLQASLDAGDMAHATSILSAASRARTATAETLRKEKRDDDKAAAKAKADENKGMFGGTPEGKMRDILLKGRTEPGWLDDPKNAAAYSQAWNILNTERRVTVGSATWMEPRLADIDDYPPPKAAPAPSSPTATGTATPKIDVPKAGEVIENPANGSRRGINPTNPREVITEFSDGSAVVHDAATGSELRRETPPKVSETAQAKLVEGGVAADKIARTSADFLAEWKRASPGQRLKAIAGGNTALSAAWAGLMAEMKGEQQYNLGVLTGPDLGIIQRAISDPSTFASVFTDEKELERIISKIPAGAKAAVEKRKELMKPPSRFPKAAASGGKPKRWNPETNQLED